MAATINDPALAQPVSVTSSKKPLIMISLTALVDMIGFGIVIPILPLYSLQFHASTLQIGLLFAAFSFMQLIFAPLLGRLSDRFGRRPVLLISLLGTSLSFLILAMANSLPLLFLGRLLDGASGGNISTAQAYIADVTPREKRGAAMGLIGAAFGLGFVIGPALGGWMGHFSIQAPFFVAAGLALLNSIGVALFLPESLSEERRRHPKPQVRVPLSQKIRLIQETGLFSTLTCLLFCTIAFSLVTAMMTLFTAQRLHWHALENGNLFAYVGVLGIIIQGGLLRRLTPKVGEKPLIILGAVCLLLGMAILPMPSEGLLPVIVPIIAGSTALSIGNSLVTPLLSAVASQSANEHTQGTVLGITQAVASLARMLGPALGGLLLAHDAANPAIPFGVTPFWASAILMILGVVAALKLRTYSDPMSSLPKAAV